MKYRAEIDGLRAFAVLSVVIYHAFPAALPGGFVGVDVFFVISGFLITRIIFEELTEDRFSFSAFFGRRVRRIFPALILVMVCSLLAGWFLLIADQYVQLSRHIAAGAYFVVNFVLVAESGYFDAAAETKPMLHLWSLAVEEQFYILWPLMLWLAWRFRFNLLALTILVAGASLLLNLVFVSQHPTETFFWPVGRFWELLSGSLLAWVVLFRPQLLPHRHDDAGTASKFLASGLSVAGLALLLGSVTLINSGLNFPGIWAVFPVLGAVCLIAAGPKPLLTRVLLMNPVAVWFGLISYPLYLWHWPLLSFLRIELGETPGKNAVLIAIGLAVLLSWLTYRFLERPIRAPGKTRARTATLATLLALTGLCALFIKEQDGFQDRIIRDGVTHRHLMEATEINYGLSKHCTRRLSLDDPTCASSEAPRMLLWGDSYAQHLALALDSSASDIGFVQQTRPSCRPIPDFAVLSERRNLEWAKACVALNDKIMDWLSSREAEAIEYVVMGSPFTYSPQALIEGEVVDVREEVFEQMIRDTVAAVAALGKKPVLVAPPPSNGTDLGACWRRAFLDEDTEACDFGRDQMGTSVYTLLERLERDVPIVYLHDLICPDDRCEVTINSLNLYRDNGHLSNAGSAEFGRVHDLSRHVIERADEFWN